MSTAQVFAPTSGTDGRVKTAVGDVIIAGIESWEWDESTAPIPIPHFESSASADGIVYPDKLKGLGDCKINIAGIYNLNSTHRTEDGTTLLRNGLTVALDLYYSRTLAVGRDGVIGFVSNFKMTQQINNQAFKFTCTVEVAGPPPAVGAVT